tara:strand:+ start:1447 stop:3183 length:1737 start_codon:yes stop_codon:yes gene_type:complete
MNKEALEANQDLYKNKAVFNQRGGSLEFNNSTGEESIYLTNYHGSNIKITPQVTSEYAKENKQLLVVNDNFETVRNDKHLSVGGNYVKKVTGSTVYQSGFSNEEQIKAIEDWKEEYRPVAERNSMFAIQRGGESYPNGVVTPKSGTKSQNPSKSQEIYLNEDQGFPSTNASSSEVNSSSNQVNSYSNYNVQPSRRVVLNPSVADYGDDENPATEGGSFDPTIEKEKLDEEITRLQEEKLTDLELKAFGDGPNVGGDDQEFTFRNKVIMVGATFNDYPSIRFDDTGRSTPGRVTVGTHAGAYVDVESVPHVEEVDNSKFPVGNYTVQAANKYNISVGSGGIDVKTTGPVEVGATSYKLAAHKVTINSSKGIHIGSENLVEINSLKNISLRSNKQIYIEPGLGVKNNLIVGGGSYLQGETYLHHVTAPAELQQTEDTTVFGKLVNGLKFRADIDLGFPLGTIRNCPITIRSSDNDIIEMVPHSHHFKNLPLRLTESGANIREMASAEDINVDGFSTPALPIGHGKKNPSTTPAAPIPLERENESTLLPHDRRRVTIDGDIKPPFPQVEKDGSFAKETPTN